jgi:hypothetical protein
MAFFIWSFLYGKKDPEYKTQMGHNFLTIQGSTDYIGLLQYNGLKYDGLLLTL